MELSKVLVVYKKNAFLKESHRTHTATFRALERILKKYRITYRAVSRGRFLPKQSYDLVVSVGGDGTFLEAARAVRDRLILGVNSDLSHSVGRLCHAHADNFEKVLRAILKDRFHSKRLNRLSLTLNGKELGDLVLNDVLITHASPAAMSRYLLKIGRKREIQRSSGVWISTAAGSTAAVKSAGGRVLPIDSAKIQYMPRELFGGHGARYRLKGGVLPAHMTVEIVSKMQEGMVYMDGAHRRVAFGYGDKLVVRNSRCPLRAVL